MIRVPSELGRLYLSVGEGTTELNSRRCGRDVIIGEGIFKGRVGKGSLVTQVRNLTLWETTGNIDDSN